MDSITLKIGSQSRTGRAGSWRLPRSNPVTGTGPRGEGKEGPPLAAGG
ncbi:MULTISPECIES: hypothetical protein [unclassified Megasphaera]|nr:hypothetical protein [Megasphaera sp. UBA4233]